MTAIQPGTRVSARDAAGELLPRIAMSPVEPGNTFDVVWVCKESEWEDARATGRQPEGMPWPASDVLLAERSVVAA